jgi:signal transduction histidine kinase
MTSLKGRLSWGLVLSLLVIFACQFFIVSYAISRLTEDQLVDRLQHECENLLSAINFNASGQIELDRLRMEPIYQRTFSGRYYIIQTENQQHLSRSLWDDDLNIDLLTPGEEKRLRIDGPEQQQLFMVLRGYKKQNHVLTVAVAENIEPLNANINRFHMTYAFISVIGLLLLLFTQRLIMLSALRPLQKVQENIIKLGRGESSHLDVEGPEEVKPLIAEINRLLTSMDRKYHRSRESLGNLAHALKTRLTLINQVAESHAFKDSLGFKSSIYESTSAMNQIIERELKRARLMGNVRPGRKVELASIINELVNTLQQIYLPKGVTIRIEQMTELDFFGDKEDLIEVLGNLLDNACKWCNQQVSLAVIGGEGITFIIEDDGAGASVSDLELLTKRGFRADESKPGSGLGLAIVDDIVESYGGTISFAQSQTLGGLRVEVKLN